MNLEKNTLTKSLVINCTLCIKYRTQRIQNKTKTLKNKSIIDDKNSINSKETSKANNNMASKNFPVINSIESENDNENDISESKSLVLLPFPYEEEDLPTQEAASATATTTTINNTNNENTSNNTVNDTNSILRPLSTAATATNNKINNENTNSNTVNNFKQQLQQITR